MRYYFAGAYARRGELAGYALEIEAAGIGATVQSRWLTADQNGADAGFSIGGLTGPETIEQAWTYGAADIADLLGCDAIVSFTGGGSRGGRHVEHGIAMALHNDDPDLRKMRLIIIGFREHVFHCHPATEVYPSFAAFLAHEIAAHLLSSADRAR